MVDFESMVKRYTDRNIDKAIAIELANQDLAKQMADNAKLAQEARAAAEPRGVNASGIDCKLVRGRSGAMLPICDTPCIVFDDWTEASDKAKSKAVFGPVVRVHYREHISAYGKIEPAPLWIPSQSSASIEPAQSSGAWQMAEAWSAVQGVKCYIRKGKDKPAELIESAEDWLDEVKSSLMDFAGDVAELKRR